MFKDVPSFQEIINSLELDIANDKERLTIKTNELSTKIENILTALRGATSFGELNSFVAVELTKLAHQVECEYWLIQEKEKISIKLNRANLKNT